MGVTSPRSTTGTAKSNGSEIHGSKNKRKQGKSETEEWNDHLQGNQYRFIVKVAEPQSEPATLGKKKTV